MTGILKDRVVPPRDVVPLHGELARLDVLVEYMTLYESYGDNRRAKLDAMEEALIHAISRRTNQGILDAQDLLEEMNSGIFAPDLAEEIRYKKISIRPPEPAFPKGNCPWFSWRNQVKAEET